MAKKKQVVPKDESKKDKFKRVVEPRVRKAIKAIALIGNCATSGYEYTPDNLAQIAAALNKAEHQLMKRFEAKGILQAEFDID